MQLSTEQIAQYDRDGYLVLPDLVAKDEVSALLEELDRVSQVEHESVFREGDGRQVKIMFALHEADSPTASPAFRALLRSPRVLGVARQLMGEEDLYLHHLKVNLKAKVLGSAWPWHQDFGSWHLDGIARPRLATMALMLHDATPMNGCLYFLPGSHQAKRIDPYWDESTAYKLWAVGPDDMARLMQQYPEPVAIEGKAGSAVFFHCNLLHASGQNLSFRDRWQAYFCFNPCDNRPVEVENARPDWVRSTNWAPLTPGPDDFLAAATAVPA